MTGGKVRWGVLSTAKIGTVKVIPALQQGRYCEVNAIASRSLADATDKAAQLSIPKAYGSYQELLDDPAIDAIYIPLPNHLHTDWAARCLAAGKHVLCEKPLGMNTRDVLALAETAANYPTLKIMEAFMYHFHPQWQFVRKMVAEGEIGDVSAIQAFFSYYNADPANIRNQPEAGGGALMDIGCYCISQSRFVLGREPERVVGSVHRDPVMKTDRLTSAMLEFGDVTACFTCSTQLDPYQRFNILGTLGRIEVEIPVNTLPDCPAKVLIHRQNTTEELLFDPCDQYTLQADEFSKAIIDNTAVPYPLDDAIRNMRVIDAVFESGRVGNWVAL